VVTRSAASPAGLARCALDRTVVVPVRPHDEKREVGRARQREGSQHVVDAAARLESAHRQQVAGRQLETRRALFGVDGTDEPWADGPADHAHAVAEVEELAQLVVDRVGGHDDRVGVLVCALRHGLVPCHPARGQGLGVRPRDGVVDGHGDLVARSHGAFVAAEGREQARRVKHAGSGQPREAVLPCRHQLAPREARLVEIGEAGQAFVHGVVLGLGGCRHDALDVAAGWRELDESARELFGVAGDPVWNGRQHLVDDHAHGGHGVFSAPESNASARATRQWRMGSNPAAAHASWPSTE
jgi:hypothetical protein